MSRGREQFGWRVGMRCQVSVPKGGGDGGMMWCLATVVGYSKGGTRIHVDLDGCDWGLALTASDAKTRLRSLHFSRAKGPVLP